MNDKQYFLDSYLSLVLEQTPSLISAVTLDGDVLFASHHYTSLQNMADSPKELLKETDLYPLDAHKKLREDIYPKVLAGEAVDWDMGIKHKDEVSRVYRVSHRLMSDLRSKKTIVFTTGLDVTETKLVENVLSQYRSRTKSSAFIDPLTGLANRALFYDRIYRSLSLVARSNGNLALLLLDLDQFNKVNNTFGHDAGDIFLQHISKQILLVLRDTDSVARLDGDKFIVVLESVDDPLDIEVIANKLLESVTVPVNINAKSVSCTASIGISLYPKDGTTVDQLLKQADTAMYKAKSGGKNQLKFFLKAMTSTAINYLLLENELRNAIEKRHLRLYYQPQVDLRTGKIVGLEALVRWQHPERGLMSPSHFIPLAEETGLIEPMGRWLLEEACQCFHAWLEQGFNFGKVAVNLSIRQIKQNIFIEDLAKTLKRSKLEAKYLELEITESAAMENPAETINILSELRAMGLSLSIDDFGTGYSSLAYLERFPVSKLKIDRSFIDDIDDIDYEATIAKSIIGLGNNMSVEVLAEGVERRVQSEWLNKYGCYLAQGFFYSKPLSANELISLVASTGRVDPSDRSIFLGLKSLSA